MLFFVLIGVIQGIVEWLPVSSQGVITLVTQAHDSHLSLNELNRLILLLHLGTFFAALIYFRKDVGALCTSLTQLKTASIKNKNLLLFLVITTMISGILGLGLQKLLGAYLSLAHQAQTTGPALTLAVGVLLIITGLLQLKAKDSGKRTIDHLTWKDGVILGLTQALATLPGISRSGSTVSLLLLCGFDKRVALHLSFLMSLPIVLAGNILLNMDQFHLMNEVWPGLLASFVFGLLTIHLLLKLAERINFSFFVLGFGALTIISVLF